MAAYCEICGSKNFHLWFEKACHLVFKHDDFKNYAVTLWFEDFQNWEEVFEYFRENRVIQRDHPEYKELFAYRKLLNEEKKAENRRKNNGSV